jgi:transcriptional regulatory protein LevR
MTDKEIKQENLRDINKANFIALSIGLQAAQKRIDDLLTKYNILANTYGTLQGQLNQFQSQRAIELQERLSNGPTVWHPSEPDKK